MVGGGAVSGAATSTTPGPLTFDQAKAQGKDVDWGPNCDTTTGKVKVPSGYAPPCVAPWKGGDNGGKTAPGVTADTITVALYQAQPDLLQQAFFENTGSDESLAKERQTTQDYVDYFSSHYELYGRKIEARHREGERRARRRRSRPRPTRSRSPPRCTRSRRSAVRARRPRTPTSSRRGACCASATA